MQVTYPHISRVWQERPLEAMPDPPGPWCDQMYKIASGTEVMVADAKRHLHKHVMKNDRYLREDTHITPVRGKQQRPEFYGVRSTQVWSIKHLADIDLWVFVTGHSKWPYLVVMKDKLEGW